MFSKLEAELAKSMMSLPASKGFDVGSGFKGVAMTGREHNDAFRKDSEGKIHTLTKVIRERLGNANQRSESTPLQLPQINPALLPDPQRLH